MGKYYRLGDLAEIGRGSSPRPITDQRYFVNGDIPWIKIADATASGKYIYKTREYVNEYGASYSRKLKRNSLIIAASGTLGFPKFLGTEGCIHDGWMYFSNIKEDILNRDYLYYCLITLNGYFNNLSYGAAIQNINTPIVKNTKVFLPDLKIQSTIASILSAYDDLIENNNRRIKILEQMAENLYKEWFVRFRFPGHEQAEFENGIPKGWEIRRFSDNIAKITAGGDRPEVYSPYKSDICTVPIFSNGTDDYGLYGYTNHPKIYEESVTVSARGTVGYVCLREEPYVPIVRLLSLVPVDKEISAKFIYYALKTDCIEGNGTSQQQMTVPMFGRKKILIPDRKLIAKFTAIVDDLFSLRRNHMIANQNLTKQHDLLLPRLMSGKLEV